MKIIVYAPHNDDEVLGVGGAIAKYAQAGNDVYVCEVTSGKMYKTLQAEARDAHKILGVKETFFLNLPVTELRNLHISELNGAIGEITNRIQPDIAFIPHKGDMHMDHGEVAKAAMVALRPVSCPQLKAIYAYETLSETEWNIASPDNTFNPNVYCDISKEIELKLEAMSCYKSQVKQYPHPRSLESLKALAMLRGSTICVPYAEAFVSIRTVL